MDIAKIASEMRRHAGLADGCGDLHDLAVGLLGDTAIRFLGDELWNADPAYRFGCDGDKILVLLSAAEGGCLAQELAYGLARWRLRDERHDSPREQERRTVRLACELLKRHAAAERRAHPGSGVHRAAPRTQVDDRRTIRRTSLG